MSILSNLVAKAKSILSKAGSIFSGGSSQTASAQSALNFNNPVNNAFQAGRSANQTLLPNMTVAPNPSVGEFGGAGTGGISQNNLFYQSGQNQALRSLAGGASGPSSPIYSAPVTIQGGSNRSGSASSFSGDSFSTQNFSTAGTTMGAGSISSAPNAVSLPSAPGYANPGTINNGGLIGALSETSQYDPATNSFVPVVDEGLEGRQKLEQMMQDLIPKKESVFEDADVRRQQAEVNQRKQEVAGYTAQLNNVVAQQNADLLRLRGIGAQEGVTETVYGGQAATINREAAIKALPIQAQIAAAQGNLELAQDYLTQLTTWKTEQIDNDYNYKKDIYNAVRDFADKEQKRKLDRLEKEDDRAYQEERDLISEQDYWVRQAVENGQAGLITRINNTRSRQELASVVSAIKPKADSTSVKLSSGGKQSLLGAGFTSSEIVSIESDINQFGIDQVLAGLTDPRQKRAVQEAYGGADNERFLSADYFKSIFTDDQLKASAKEAGFTAGGFLGIGTGERGVNEYIDHLTGLVDQYRVAGYTDQEILKMMK